MQLALSSYVGRRVVCIGEVQQLHTAATETLPSVMWVSLLVSLVFAKLCVTKNAQVA